MSGLVVGLVCCLTDLDIFPGAAPDGIVGTSTPAASHHSNTDFRASSMDLFGVLCRPIYLGLNKPDNMSGDVYLRCVFNTLETR